MENNTNSSFKDQLKLLAINEIKMLDNEITYLQRQIRLFPKKSVEIDYTYIIYGIFGIYKLADNFNFKGTNYDKKTVKKAIKKNNKLVLKKYKLETKYDLDKKTLTKNNIKVKK